MFECISDLLFGLTLTKGSLQERNEASSYEKSAQIVNVIWRAWFKETERHDLSNFLYTHDKFVHPEYVIDKKHITLHSIFKDHVLFCVSDPDENIYDTKKYPFVWIGQFLVAQKLVIMPISSFHRVAEKVGDPKVPVLGINMTARKVNHSCKELF